MIRGRHTQRWHAPAWVVIVVTLIGFSCEEGSPEPFLRGDFIGRVSTILDEFGQPMTDRSHYDVTLQGSKPERTTSTDANGNFAFEDLKSGTYNLIFSKPGFETRKVFSVQFTGGNVPTYYEAPLLSQLSSTSIKDFSISVTNEGNTNPDEFTMLEIEIDSEPALTHQGRTVVVYLHTEPTVSATHYTFPQLNVTDARSLIRLKKIDNGLTLYAVAYPTPAACNGYYDPDRAVYINACVGNPTSTVEFVVP